MTHSIACLFAEPKTLSHEQITYLVDMVNAVYKEGEGVLFKDGLERTSQERALELIQKDELLCLYVDKKLKGCAHVSHNDSDTLKFGMLSVDPTLKGQGYGKHLVSFIEAYARKQGIHKIRLEFLEPAQGTHEHKKFLRDWYLRLGYTPIGTGAFPMQHMLAVPCTFTFFEKTL